MATTSIGKYRVTRTLAGEGDRHLARTEGGDRCQLRLLDLSPAADWEQADREIAICQQLDEHGIGKTLEVFEHEGRLAVVSEALDGEPLDRLMAALTEKGQSLDPKAVWFIGHQIAGALAVAHSASDADGDLVSICHGYLAPEQITVAWNGTVRLDGLGVASLVGGACSPGMAAYAAPEQASGGRVTPRGDSYSLAVVLWALLAGKIPEPGGAELDGVAEGVPEIMRTALATALEASLGKRRITSMELEQWLGDVADSSGKGALATAMGVLRRGHLSGGTARAASDTPSVPAAQRGKSSPERKYPPLRPRKATLVGTAPTGESAGAPTANLDWLKTGDGAEKPAAAEEISWSGDDDDDATFEPDDEEETLVVAVSPLPKASPPAVGAGAEGVGRAADRLSEDDISEAMARADRVVEDLSALDVPPSTFDVRGGASDAGPVEDSLDELEDGQDPPELAAAVISSAPPPATRRSTPHGLPTPAKPVTEPGPPVPQDPEIVSVEEGVVQLGASPAGALPTEPAEEPLAGLATPPEPASPSPLVTDSAAGGDGSPWTPDEQAAAAGVEAPAPPRLSLATAILVTLATAVLTMVVGVWWVRHRATIAAPAAPTASSSSTVSSPSAASSPPAGSSLASRRRAVPRASAGASAAASGDPAGPPDDGKDGTALPPTMGYLVVTFAGDPHAEVYSAGQKLGPANQKIEAPCLHPAFLRIGASQAGGAVRWLTAGRPGVKIACQSVTKLTMAP